MNKLGGLHTKPSLPYPSGRRYDVWKPRSNGKACAFCGGQILTPRPEARYCGDPVCQAIAQRKRSTAARAAGRRPTR